MSLRYKSLVRFLFVAQQMVKNPGLQAIKPIASSDTTCWTYDGSTTVLKSVGASVQ